MAQQIRPTTYERITLLGLGGAVVLALLFLVISNTHVDSSLAMTLRLLLSLAAALFGGLLPGAAFNVGVRSYGLAMRAAGAAAFFVIVWLGGPGLLGRLVGSAAPAPAPAAAAPSKPAPSRPAAPAPAPAPAPAGQP